uniref:Uncharacterized protein n=1 Tax=Anguilla anguilla TaxID=7936 RepID=A0A0E9V665_ANGAN
MDACVWQNAGINPEKKMKWLVFCSIIRTA